MGYFPVVNCFQICIFVLIATTFTLYTFIILKL